MRGKVVCTVTSCVMPRITPAYAGKSKIIKSVAICIGDHPRLCGEKAPKFSNKSKNRGSPPPMRGKGAEQDDKHGAIRITPAYAGKRQRRNICTYIGQDHPRLCGEKMITSYFVIMFLGSPPPMRGKGKHGAWAYRNYGITPAYAGKSL